MIKNLIKIVFLLCALNVSLQAELTHPKQLSHRNLLDFMIRTRDISHTNSRRSMACFDYYVPILNNITAEYETSYATCLATADAAKVEIEHSTLAERQCMSKKAESACDQLKFCAQIENSVDFFECYVETGNSNAKIMVSISHNALDILTELREKYHRVEYEQNRCTNAAERAYVSNTTATYEEMQSCLQGSTTIPENQVTVFENNLTAVEMASETKTKRNTVS